VPDATDELYPVIPLMGACRAEETLEDWPRGRFNPDRIEDAVRRRLSAVLTAAAKEAAPKNPILHVLVKGYLELGKSFAETRLTDLVMEKVRESLVAKFL
jgi:hypothetical protein